MPASTHPDPWLARWLPLVVERGASTGVLELGCGSGRDTMVLAEAGLRIVALDMSKGTLEEARLRAPNAQFHCQDVRAPWPKAAQGLGAAVASLSLHYFDWDETVALVERVRSVLRPGGVFLCRVNSTHDTNYGAVGHPEIARNYYLVDGKPKRFFDREALGELFATGWKTLSIEEHVIHRYELPKSVWEVVAERI